MKNLLFGLSVLLFAASCGQNKGSTAFPGATAAEAKMRPMLPPASVKALSLNNIDKATALKMIDHFARYSAHDNKPSIVSYWISWDMLNAMVTMLDKELAAQTSTSKPGPIDGVRIYFAADPSVTTFPLKPTIILVSTKDSGDFSPQERLHHDYYEHAANDALFSLNSIVQPGVAAAPGAKLYAVSGERDDVNCVPLPHNITRDKAEKMVMGFKNHAINTVSEWFDLNMFEVLAKDPHHYGLRIYYATHPNTDTGIEGRDAFVITTTLYDAAARANVDVFDCSVISNVRKSYNKNKKARSPLFPPPGDDNGELCPYNCN
ncbi:hypothetical protein BDD43_0427 [Mucilaginibacter gracilis]|uniref:Uncharacterized protein n=1 Tax=Mucilaginibacter gracilis TaxID=423350 RepID=A0A495IUG5_9SPHI|nr:hypothetical protein [Mucilaginibacter gracilis]RKR80330.1 hypothetical protein BDD43_0427 [Mucilaginibacter gracilis]